MGEPTTGAEWAEPAESAGTLSRSQGWLRQGAWRSRRRGRSLLGAESGGRGLVGGVAKEESGAQAGRLAKAGGGAIEGVAVRGGVYSATATMIGGEGVGGASWEGGGGGGGGRAPELSLQRCAEWRECTQGCCKACVLGIDF